MIRAKRAPPMELDLDSRLLSGGGGGAAAPASSEDIGVDLRRTVDDILNDYDSSSSDVTDAHRRTVDDILNDFDSSEEDPPPRVANLMVEPREADETPTTETLEEAPTTSHFAWSKRPRDPPSLGLRNFSASRPLPPLFGGVRPSPKPGAALAAAAAASRPVLTPHAAAIKSRRFGAERTFSAPELSPHREESCGSEGLDGSEVSELAILHPPSSSDVEESSEAVIFDGEVSGKGVGLEVADEPEIADQVEANEYSTESDYLVSTPIDDVDMSLQLQDVVEDVQEEESAELGSKRDDLDLVKSQDEQTDVVGEEIDNRIEGGRLFEESLFFPSAEDCEKAKKKADKKLQASMKPLEWAEELEKRQASYGQHCKEGAAAQQMKLEGIRRDPQAVGYLQIDLDNVITRLFSSQSFKRDHGSPQVVVVHMNFIAIGMSKGAVFVVPSKYSSHSADTMDTKMINLCSNGEKSQTPVTSMCFNQQGDLLLAGYGDGHLTLWDVQKGAVAKLVSGAHAAPVVHTLFLGQDLQVTRQFKSVTCDATGLVLLHTFSVLPLWGFSIKSQTFPKMGTILSVRPIRTDDFSGLGYVTSQGNSTTPASGLGSMVGGVVGGVVGGEAGWKLFNEGSSMPEEGVVIFVTHQNALVVRLSPTVEVYEKLSRPDGVREGSIPYTAWKCMTYSHDASLDPSDRASWLVIVWDRSVQVEKLVNSEMKKYSEWNLDSAAIGVAWLDDQMLVILTLRGQLCLFSKDGTELHRTSFVIDGTGIDDIITYHTYFTNIFGNPEKAYHNSVAVRGASIYIIGPMHLIISRLLPWKERIQVLQKAGDWIGALDMAMRLYDGHAHGVIDLPRKVEAIREAIMPYLVELLLSYVDEVFSYISMAFSSQIAKVGQADDPNFTDSSVRTEIEEQYARVGGVAVEFCVHVKRTDILFDTIFSKFVAVQHGGTFLEILEPYILKDMLGSLPPEIMQALVEHYSGKGWLQRVEQCVLHMDISSLDFNQVVKLCREHGLYGALIYLFNQGLDDYKTPLEELLMVVQSGQRVDAAAIGYRMLVYLKYCFLGLAFPPGHGTLPPNRSQSVARELLQFLLEDSKSLDSQVSRSFRSSCGTWPNLCHLLLLDTEATLEVLRHAFIKDDSTELDNCLSDLSASNLEQKDNDSQSAKNQYLMAQSAIDKLIYVLDMESNKIRSFSWDESVEVWPSEKDLGQLFQFIVFLVTWTGAAISRQVFKHILEYLTSVDWIQCDSSQRPEASKREKQVLALLKVVPQANWSSNVLELCAEAQFHQACGFIHTIRGHHIAALDSFMKDLDEPVNSFAFINNMLLKLKDVEAESFRSAVISCIAELVKLSRECTFFLIIDHFSLENQQILSELRSQPHSLFLFLKTVIEVHLFGALNFPAYKVDHVSRMPIGGIGPPNELDAYMERLSNFPKLLQHNPVHVTDDMAELYLELLCCYEPKSVLKFLETFDNYRLEHCLRLCQEYEVIDATAFLLERVGDVGSALGLLMTGLDKKFDLLVTAVQSMFSEISASNSTGMKMLNDLSTMDEVISVCDVLHASIGLCQRNTQRLDPQESESLWFRLLDKFTEPLKRFCGGKEVQERWDVSKLNVIADTQQKDKSFSRWGFSKELNCRDILRKMFSQFVGEIIERMAGYIPLPAIMAKLLSDNGNQEFGDFKFTILKMLGTYGYERRILDTAKTLIEDDTFYTMNLLRKGASHAYVPQDSMCCICGCSLTKGLSTSGIRVFNCGHSTHLHCEENEPSNKTSSAGCPICIPKKNPTARSKSVLVENGQLRNGSSNLQIQGNSSVHEPDPIEKPYGFQKMSRFEILSNLQNGKKSLQIDTLPPLRLSPPAIYHEKVQKRPTSTTGEASSTSAKSEKTNKRWQLRESKLNGPLSRFPLKANLFSTEKNKLW
ncbi:hypothetical protein J5N97_017930 [Dioscorea zingiberensis]|uniref:RING-type domain-containing protein n=1 Tax=Dioscorea zingiberensis TaxID=325984 RepID=A0A9D5CMH4_9LILI|nr:hypothetical protein J5N97_017930 [Dioscorea zingiberensis]